MPRRLWKCSNKTGFGLITQILLLESDNIMSWLVLPVIRADLFLPSSCIKLLPCYYLCIDIKIFFFHVS
ncbi:hypothetical protein ElyMa_001068500 [Elysia marginata]|uniref:Uncharacterized protein n=1 Tax=Elysia marginata TaxID=1093978 RepID=A0AAV4HQ91_9GAST|nr:hypothetical protein ElyMa_001068500 [Elysia marginata]